MIQGGSAVLYDRNVTARAARHQRRDGSPRRATSRSTACSRRRCSRRCRLPSPPPTRRLRSALKRSMSRPSATPACSSSTTHIAASPAQRITLMFTRPGRYARARGRRRRRTTYSGRGETELHERGDAIPRRRLRAHASRRRPDEHSSANACSERPASSCLQPLPPGTTTSTCEKPTRRRCCRDRRAITLDGGGIYGVLATDGPDTATATVTLSTTSLESSAASAPAARDLLSFAGHYQLARAPVAQGIERSPPKRKVTGSNPVRGANLPGCKGSRKQRVGFRQSGNPRRARALL